MTVFKNQVTEKQIESKLRAEITKLKGFCIKFKAPAFNGVPDRLILLPGKQFYFVELKKPKGGILSPVQITVHKLFARLGFEVKTIFTFEQLNDFILEITL
jgi:hypothetical protein